MNQLYETTGYGDDSRFCISVTILSVGKRRPEVDCVPFMLRHRPSTVGELIALTVDGCVSEYNSRVARSADCPVPLSASELDVKERLGKIAFGINYGGRKADSDEAVKVALQAYADGLVRIILPEGEAGDIDSSVCIEEGGTVTFIKLAMLAGRMW